MGMRDFLEVSIPLKAKIWPNKTISKQSRLTKLKHMIKRISEKLQLLYFLFYIRSLLLA